MINLNKIKVCLFANEIEFKDQLGKNQSLTYLFIKG